MKITGLEKLFHPLFNKISNICVAACSNKKLLKEECKIKSIDEESRKRISHIISVLDSIEENANLLHKLLQKLYKSMIKEKMTNQLPLPK